MSFHKTVSIGIPEYYVKVVQSLNESHLHSRFLTGKISLKGKSFPFPFRDPFRENLDQSFKFTVTAINTI